MEDEGAAVDLHNSMVPEDFEFLLQWTPGQDWGTYLSWLDQARRGESLPDGYVPAAFLAAESGGQLVGRASIRFRLNPFLAARGGHIGYGVGQRFRRRGLATEILRQSLVIARSEGVDRVLLTCKESNIGSATVIERCGGTFESIYVDPELEPDQDDARVRRYWFD
jgi:predicted acetyltransferase